MLIMIRQLVFTALHGYSAPQVGLLCFQMMCPDLACRL
jgi:hypothetical protein